MLADFDVDDVERYLSEKFNPNELGVSQLRSILVKFTIKYASSCKKTQLIDLFKKEVYSKRQDHLSERRLVIRSSEGIMDATPRRIVTSVPITSPNNLNRLQTRESEIAWDSKAFAKASVSQKEAARIILGIREDERD